MTAVPLVDPAVREELAARYFGGWFTEKPPVNSDLDRIKADHDDAIRLAGCRQARKRLPTRRGMNWLAERNYQRYNGLQSG